MFELAVLFTEHPVILPHIVTQLVLVGRVALISAALGARAQVPHLFQCLLVLLRRHVFEGDYNFIM